MHALRENMLFYIEKSNFVWNQGHTNRSCFYIYIRFGVCTTPFYIVSMCVILDGFFFLICLLYIIINSCAFSG